MQFLKKLHDFKHVMLGAERAVWFSLFYGHLAALGPGPGPAAVAAACGIGVAAPTQSPLMPCAYGQARPRNNKSA